jgi:hypothetical protein
MRLRFGDADRPGYAFLGGLGLRNLESSADAVLRIEMNAIASTGSRHIEPSFAATTIDFHLKGPAGDRITIVENSTKFVDLGPLAPDSETRKQIILMRLH